MSELDQSNVARKVTVMIQVDKYGTREQCEKETLQSVGQAMHRMYGSMFHMWLRDAETQVFKHVEYDHLAHDGEHDGHDDIIVMDPT